MATARRTQKTRENKGVASANIENVHLGDVRGRRQSKKANRRWQKNVQRGPEGGRAEASAGLATVKFFACVCRPRGRPREYLTQHNIHNFFYSTILYPRLVGSAATVSS